MSIAPNATIRVTDSDCGTQPQGVGACTGGNSNTVADIICGTNATCTTSNSPSGQTNANLIVTMTTSPSIVSAGSVAGAQYPVKITDSTGITDLSGNAWNLAAGDTVFGPQGN